MRAYDDWMNRNSYVKLVANVDGTVFTTTSPSIVIFGRDAALRKTHLGRRFLFCRLIGTKQWDGVYGNVVVLDEAANGTPNPWWARITATHEAPLKMYGRVCVMVRNYGLLDERDAIEIVRDGLDRYYKRTKNSGK